MATARYWRAVLVGYFHTGPWLGEAATTGISGIAADAGGVFPGAIRETLPSFEANASGLSADLTDFLVNYGTIGSGDWTKANQDFIAGHMWTFANQIKGLQDNDFRWEQVRITAYDGNNDVINGASVYTAKTPIVGSSTAFSWSPSTAIAASLRTAARGPSGRGRMFIPAHAITVTNGLVAPAVQTIVGDAVSDLVTAVNTSGAVQAVVVSRTHQFFSSIMDVRVGDELDDISRRRRQRREQYTKFSV